MNADDLVSYLEARQQEILQKALCGLPEALQREYTELAIAIRQARSVLEFVPSTVSHSEASSGEKTPIIMATHLQPQLSNNQEKDGQLQQLQAAPLLFNDNSDPTPTLADITAERVAEGAKRIPLVRRMQALKLFLGRFGPTPRHKIMEMLHIPSATLSLLLREDDFEKDENGMWRLLNPEAEGFPEQEEDD